MTIKKVIIDMEKGTVSIESSGTKESITEIKHKLSPPFTKSDYMNFLDNKIDNEKMDGEIGKEIMRILELENKKEHQTLITSRRAGKSNEKIGIEKGRTPSAISSRFNAIWKLLDKQWKKEYRI